MKSFAQESALICALIALVGSPRNCLTQVRPHSAPQLSSAILVPFVGCASDGQVGPLRAPEGKSKTVVIGSAAAQRLAYYEAEDGFGILAPRGWHCFSTYGSNGSSLFVSPEPIKSRDLFSDDWKGFTGPAIQVSTVNGDTSGRFEVARTISRVFPAHKAFVDNVIAEKIEPASDFPKGPFPNDKLTYHGNECVDYWTPANAEGLGTASRLQKNDEPISGVAILAGEETNLVQAAIRLPKDTVELAPAIVQQLRQDVAQSH